MVIFFIGLFFIVFLSTSLILSILLALITVLDLIVLFALFVLLRIAYCLLLINYRLSVFTPKPFLILSNSSSLFF